MEKLFENTTTYTSEIYADFVRFHNKKYNFRYHLYTLFILFLITFCMVLQFLYGDIRVGIIFVIAMVAFLFWRVFHPYFFIKKEANSKKVKDNLRNTYSFYNKYMEVKNSKSYIHLKYYKIYKIFETSNYFYLYLNKNYAFVINKNGFTLGNEKDFYGFIKKKIWYKV